MTSSVDPRPDIAAILARLATLPEPVYEGIEADTELPLDAWGRKAPYRDFEAGSSIPSAGQRSVGAGEQAQPHVWAFQIHHFGATRTIANNLAIDSDMALIGWEPSEGAGPISTFYFTMYDETAKNGDRLGWISTRFYQTTLGQNPDL